MVSQLFPLRDYLQACGSQDFTSALETAGNFWATSSVDIIIFLQDPSYETLSHTNSFPLQKSCTDNKPNVQISYRIAEGMNLIVE
jgi:hypothetical protein